MGVEAALIISATAAAVSTGVSISNSMAAHDAANAEKDLANSQRDALKKQQDAAAAQAAAQATTGSTFGFSDAPHAIATGLGFGTAPTGSANAGRAQITGGL